MQSKTKIRYHHTSTRLPTIKMKKKATSPNADAGGTIIWQATLESTLAVSLKTKHKTTV